MAKKSSAKKQHKVFRSKEDIQRLLADVAAAQAAGSTLTAALKKLKIPYNTYNNWAKKSGKAAPTPSTLKPAAKKGIKGKVSAAGKSKSTRQIFSPEQKDEMRQRDRELKAEGKTDKVVAKILGIAMMTLYRLRKDSKAIAAKPRARAAVASQIQLSPKNPMYQLTVAHERLLSVNSQIEELTAERDKLVGKIDVLAKKAVEALAGLRGGKK